MIAEITIFFSLFYAAFLFWCLYHWSGIKNLPIQKSNSSIKVAIIVPVRNEEENIVKLLESISKQDYPEFELILADDHSTDETIAKAEKWKQANPGFNFRCVSSLNASKKSAIAYAISLTDAQLIVTTDADCIASPAWITTLVGHYLLNKSFLIAGPVLMIPEESISAKIQSAEYAGLMVMGAAAIHARRPMFCSGANLAFEREKFLEVGGYNDSKSISGDDTQLLLKFHEHWPDKISFVKDKRALVKTNVEKKNLDFLQQRKRWASKIPTTLSTYTIVVAAFAWFLHALIVVDILFSIYHFSFGAILIALAIKTGAELIFLRASTMNYKIHIPVAHIILIQPVYALYIFSVGLIAPFAKFNWKERSSK